MQKYKYKAVDIQGKKYSGIYIAESVSDLENKLSDKGLFLTKSSIVKNSTPNPFFTLTGKVSSKDLSNFCSQFSLLLNSSLEIVDCLELLKVQQKNNYFKQILEMVYQDVKVGQSLADAFEKHKKAFPNFFLSMIYVGEMSCSLPTVLKSLAEYIQHENTLKLKVKGALTYPLVILILMFAIFILMMVFIIPTFRDSMDTLGIELPQLTKSIYGISDFVSAYWMYIFLGIVGVVFLLKLIGKTKKGRYFFDKLKFNIPLVKTITRDLVTARLSRGLALLIQSGMKLVDAMNVAKKLIGNKFVEEKFQNAILDVEKGKSLSQSLKNMNIFPTTFLQMIKVSEKTATLESGMFNTADYFDTIVDNKLTNLTNLIQPILLVIMGVIIAIVFIAVYSPMTAMMQNL